MGVLLDDLKGLSSLKGKGWFQVMVTHSPLVVMRGTLQLWLSSFCIFYCILFFFVLFSSREEWKVLTSGVGNQKSTLQPRSHLVA